MVGNNPTKNKNNSPEQGLASSITSRSSGILPRAKCWKQASSLRRNVLLTFCLFSVAFFLAKSFYFSIIWISEESLLDEANAGAGERQRWAVVAVNLAQLDLERHCFFTVHQLWGKGHDAGRRNATMQWFQEATIPSIIRAATESAQSINSNNNNNNNNTSGSLIAHIGIHLITRDAYADTRLHDAIANNNHNHNHGVTIVYQNHHNVMKQNIIDHRCGVVSFLQLDVDDMLMPRAFQNVHEPWTQHLQALHQDPHSPTRHQWCRGNPQQHRCPRAMVTGMYQIPTFNLAINGQNASGPPNCYFRIQPRCSFFSQGLTVTLPVKLWLQHFQANPTTVATFAPHDFILTELRKKVGRFVKVYENKARRDHAIFVRTTLSSHYIHNRSRAKICDREYLLDVLEDNVAAVDLLWQARQSIPVLTEAQRNQNTFVIDPNDGSSGYNKVF